MTATTCRRLRWLLAALLALGLNTAASLTGRTDAACLAALAAWAGYCLWSLRPAGRDENTGSRLLLASGFTMGLIFVLRLPHLFSWHDLAEYSADFSNPDRRPDGHLGYIAWIVENLRLPLEMNPLEEGFSIFYNPPFYHIVQAAFMKLNLLALPLDAALENLQIVTFFCAFGVLCTVRQLLEELNFSPRAVRAGLWALCFQPMIHLLGATLNNDILMVFLALRCCLYVARWYHSRSLRDILCCGLCLGLGMATKLNCALLVPGVAFVFIYAFFSEPPARRRKYIGLFAAFLAVSVPEAVAWPLHNLIAFGVPLHYVRLPAKTLDVSALSLWARFGVPDWHARRGLFYTGVRRIDHNVWMRTLASGLFDELTLFAEGTAMWYVCYVLLAAFAALLLAGLISFAQKTLSRRDAVPRPISIFLLSYGALLPGSYLKLCVDYPYLCTFNFRYILPVLALCAVGFAALSERKYAGIPARLLTVGFSLLSAGVYAVYFLS